MIRRTSNNEQAGFTLIELMLAMAFVAFLLMFVVFATIEVMGNYNKGIAIKEINQTARTIVEEMSRLVRSTDAEAINTARLADGRVCFGGVSYVWNIRGGVGDSTPNRYTDNSLVTMARVEDAAGALCGAGLPNVNPAQSVSLLTSQIWVQNTTVTVSPNLKLVDMRIRLSTSNDNQPNGTGPNGFVCQGGRGGNFCAVADFNTTVSTRNGGE